MQTFLPYPSFALSASVLDRQRLGKQRVEVLQLLKAITTGCAWSKHPAAKMWENNIDALCDYGIAICKEWIFRGYKDTCLEKIKAYKTYTVTLIPSWLGNEDFHRSHRSNLLRKNFEHYSQFFNEPNNLEYIWPSKGDD